MLITTAKRVNRKFQILHRPGGAVISWRSGIEASQPGAHRSPATGSAGHFQCAWNHSQGECHPGPGRYRGSHQTDATCGGITTTSIRPNDDIDPGANKLAVGDDVNLVLVDESTLDSRLDDKLDSSARRILYFPDGSGAGEDIDGFESEVKMTLQAIRDQLQNMTERLFRQERATNDLQQTMAELKDAGGFSAGNKGNKSS